MIQLISRNPHLTVPARTFPLRLAQPAPYFGATSKYNRDETFAPPSTALGRLALAAEMTWNQAKRAWQGFRNDHQNSQRLVEDLKNSALTFLRNLYVEARNVLESWGEKLGFHKPVRTPRPCVADAYTVASHHIISDDALDASTYQITLRRELTPWMKALGLKPEEARYAFFGLQQIIQKILQDPATLLEDAEAANYLNTAKAGKPFKHDRTLIKRVLEENHGIWPIKIEALPDGSAFFPGEPVVQITAKKGFGELAAYFETKLLQVWATTERASMVRHWLDYNKKLVRRCTSETLSEADVTARAQRMMADFSDRSSMNADESELLGMATVLSMPTTATVSAAYQAYKAAGDKHAAKLSMYSLAHRVVESYKDEKDAYVALFHFARHDIGSYVADCYDYRKAVTQHLLPLALQAQAEHKAEHQMGLAKPPTIVCARPDSGDAFDEILFTLKAAEKAGLCEDVTAADGRKLKKMTYLRVIEADGMTFAKQMEVNEKLIDAGFSPPDCVYYGVGGYLHDGISRSNTSAAMKLAEVGEDHRPVAKSPKDEPAKASIAGEIKICREPGKPTVRHTKEPGKNEMVTYYDGIDGPGMVYHEDFLAVQDRVLNHFNDFPHPGIGNLYSTSVTDLRTALYNAHHPEEAAPSHATSAQ